MLEKEADKRLDLMKFMDMEFIKMEDEEYEAYVNENSEKFAQQKEESKTKEVEVPKVPSPRAANAGAKAKSTPVVGKGPAGASPGLRKPAGGSAVNPNKGPTTNKYKQ